MTKLFCQTCGNIYYAKDKTLLVKCPRCGSISYTMYASAIHRYFKCEKCKRIVKLSEVAARHFALNKDRPTCQKCGGKIMKISTEGNYKKDSGQAKKITKDTTNSLDKYGLKVWNE